MKLRDQLISLLRWPAAYRAFQNVPQIVGATAQGSYIYTADDTIDVSIISILTATAAGIFNLTVTYTMDV